MPVVVGPDHVRHDVATGVWCGVTEASDELPVRAEIIATACAMAGAPIVEAVDHGLDALLRVHDPRFLAVAGVRLPTLGGRRPPRTRPASRTSRRTSSRRWRAHHGGSRRRGAATIRAEIGFYAMDTMTCIGEGTWTGAKAAADAAATAADLVADGAGVAYAVCRPPGHHAGPAFFGGSCYLNNAAVAAAQLRADGLERVAIVDIDAHHGNGTQAIFWNDPAGVLRIGACRSCCRLVPSHRRPRRRDRRHLHQSQRAGRPGYDGRRVAGSMHIVAGGRRAIRTRCVGRVARCRCGPRRSEQSSSRHRTQASVRSAG